MKNRDEYVAQLKARLDKWNAEAAKWEARANAVKSQQLVEYRAQRDKALYNLKLLEGASASAWTDIAQGADEAWDRMQAAFDKARVHFEKSNKAS
jgi:hypothetical protein